MQGGAGMQSYWMLEYGAKHVIMMELSNTIDNIVQENFKNVNIENFDIIQCSIDNPPIKSNSIEGIVMCHNVIQHTPSIETYRNTEKISKSELKTILDNVEKHISLLKK